MDMIQIILMYFSTILISKGIDTYNILSRMKDLTDAGYKLKMETIDNDIHKELRIKDDYWLIPFYNIYDALKGYYDYQNNKSDLLYQEYSFDRVEELNPREKRKYEESPTMLNAWLLQYKMENIRDNASEISLSDGSKIYYTMDALDGIKFVDCIGPSQYRDERQLTSYLLDGYELVIDEYQTNIEKEITDIDELEQKIKDINEIREYLKTAREKLYNQKQENTLIKKL